MKIKKIEGLIILNVNLESKNSLINKYGIKEYQADDIIEFIHNNKDVYNIVIEK